MARYFDVDIAVAQITQLKDNDLSEYDLGLDTASNEIKYHMPTADVVPVVRCKDCDNWTDENGREGLCQVWSDFEISHLRYTPKDGYCSEGERRDDGD